MDGSNLTLETNLSLASEVSINETGYVDSQQNQTCQTFDLLFNTLLIGSLDVIGIFGNVLSILVLQKDRHNRVAVFLLQSLAVSDSLLLFISFAVLSIVIGLMPAVNQHDCPHDLVPYVLKYLQPVAYMVKDATVWITVLLAVNRYVAIVKPFLAHKLCTMTRVRFQVLAVVVFVVVFNFPRFFQTVIVYRTDHNNCTTVDSVQSIIGRHTSFDVIYTNAIYSVLVLIIPLLILVVLNTCLVRELKCSTLSVPNSPLEMGTGNGRRFSGAINSRPEEDNVTVIMVTIIVVFLLCHTPDRIIVLVRYAFKLDEDLVCGQALYYLSSICNLLIVVSSSCNFIIYYLLRRRFRKTLVQKLCAWRRFKKHRHVPDFLASSAAIRRRNTDTVMATNGTHGHLLDKQEIDALSKRGSVPLLKEVEGKALKAGM